tara:strand:+ start:722 stop:1045 length:324 start_codon:yes stop_codon:yes gene_type:complete
MHNLLTKLLKKREINKVDDLSKDERETFEKWNSILTKRILEVDDIKNFCCNQIGLIESKWKDMDITKEKKADLISYHTVYKGMVDLMESPVAERASLEKFLHNLLQG